MAVTAAETISLSISATIVSVSLPANATRLGVEAGVGLAEGDRIVERLFLLVDQLAQLPRGGSPAGRPGDGGRGHGFDQATGVVDVGQRHVARLQHQGRGPGRHLAAGLVDDDPTERAPHHGDEALGLEDAQGLAQRRAGHAEALDEIGFTAERVALGQLAADDERTQLVGDQLRLLSSW